MEIQRIDSYTDPRFPKEVLYQHGAFLVNGAPWTFRVSRTTRPKSPGRA